MSTVIQRTNLNAARARRRSIALALAALAAGALACSVPTFAGASTPTSQASYYGLDWVPYIDPADLPPMAERPVACIVDTGVALTSDLPAADLNGQIVGRIATDGSAGEPSSNVWPLSHGTSMATYAFGADNDWGLTGIFPQGRFLSVRANINNPESIDYPTGMKKCRTFTGTNNLSLATISLSLGSDGVDNGFLFADELQRALNNNYAVVASAGNSPGPVIAPANTAGVFTAAAGVVGGGLCSYAAYGPQVEIVGPSCQITDTDPFTGTVYSSDNGGSSMAAVVTSATVLMLRSLVPTATTTQVQDWIIAGSNVVDGKPLLNGYGAMHAAGLDAIVARAQARQQVAQQVDNPPNGNQKDASKSLRTPRARVSFSRGSVRIKALNRPAKAKLVVALIYRKSEFETSNLKRSASKSTLKIRSKKRPWRVEVRYVKGFSVSPTIRFRDRRTTTFVQLNGSSNK